MTQYLAKVKEMMGKFDRCTINQIPRDENARADALSKFGSMMEGVKDRKITVMVKSVPVIEEKHLKTRLEGAKRAWVEELLGVLWACRTTPQIATGETPFYLFYGSKVVIPAEIREETTRVVQYEPKENSQERSFDLTVIEEGRDRAYAKILRYKSMMTKSYNRRVRSRSFQVGDLVLKKVEVTKHVGKLDPTWEGPYKVVEIRKKGTYTLQDMEGKNLP
ncbi:uncharacterized protein LOC105165037 [Sesamum indicum]|uniref:Uncharacterized protein LOC105165037 n=1 Tax=Sesamum indicum TaxID=4182 RepID=A0A6I9TBQ3_SESIN|nr:uncharacterized protein LOC105165037 [Sesamum indicum]